MAGGSHGLLAAGDWTAVIATVPSTPFHFHFLNVFYFLNEATPSLFIRMIVTALESHSGRAHLLTSPGARGQCLQSMWVCSLMAVIPVLICPTLS